MSCPLCGGGLALVYHYDAPPKVETHFELPPGQAYDRSYMRCENCGLFVSEHELDLSGLYEGGYVDATYSDSEGLRRNFERIMALPPERSDNTQRVERVTSELGRSGTLLDVGSGLAVFPARMKEAGWECTALDPDPRAAAFTREQVGIDAVAADFMQADDLGSFDLVSFNKVLEHVEEPVAMLARAKVVLDDGGAVYVELPDAEGAAADPDGPEREEFCDRAPVRLLGRRRSGCSPSAPGLR